MQMKIFSNFDTNRKKEAYQEAITKYGVENVLLLSKSWLFFFQRVFFPVFIWLTVFCVLQYGLFFLAEDRGIWWYVAIGILFLLFVIVISPNIKYYLDYTMDFSLFTPDTLTRYNQTGFFKRDIKTSNVRNIKTISIQKNSLRYNIFDNGDLIFLSEGNNTDRGEITLHYISDPESKKKAISRIMNP